MKNKRLFLSKLLIGTSWALYSHIVLNNAGMFPHINAMTPAMVVTINGLLTALIIFTVALSMIVSNGKHFKFLFISSIAALCATILGVFVNYKTVLQGFEGCGAGIGLLLLNLALVYTLHRYQLHLKRDEDELDRAAYTDQLTGCLNRRGLLRELQIKSDFCKEFYLAFLDLDNFKQVNDTLGHEAGDELLLEIATTWTHLKSRVPYTVCRLGGDEFAIIIESSNIEVVKDFITKVLQSTTTLQSKFSNYITASAGLAHFTKDTNDLQQLLAYADTAMYKAKLSGKNDFYFFDQDMYREIIKRYLTEKDIRDALKNNSFTMMYQPQYSIYDHKLVGFESLIRLRDKQGNFINTQEFIRVAEKSGLIYEIDLWVMHNVMVQMKDFVTLHPDVEVSINISGKHITNPGFVERVMDSIAATQFPPKNLKIEITESSYIRYIDEAVSVVHRLKVLGIKTALDDFGTGYSSLNYLSKMPVDLLKIDKSFVDVMLAKPGDRSFVDIIIKLGHLMGCKVIAEGVEYQEQLETLAALECDYVQGYIWGKPMELEKVSECL